ncbi:MAG TPA: GNAT family N-acetyltransferase [Candidatus Limnocylindrales bacterium]
MTVPTLDSEPDCARETAHETGDRGGGRTPRRLIAERRAFDSISRDTWDRLAGLNPWATPFSAWGFHRAWWDAYGENAHDQTLVVLDPRAAATANPVAIVPLMHRHVVEADDAETHTSIRHGTEASLTPVAPTAKAVYLGATYHADYATLLADPLDLSEVAEAVVEALAGQTAIDPRHPLPWDIVDLRRFRTGDPAADALAAAFGAREIAEGWTLNLEPEDVCPVAPLPGDGTPGAASMDDFLATLGKHDRHEIRRKVRRAEAAGEITLVDATDPLGDLQSFIELHQARWGDDGLFPPTRGGDQSRVFVSRMLELLGPDTTAPVGHAHLSFLTLDGARIGASIFFVTRDALLYYNAGVSPEARQLSPGVVMVERLARRALELGLCRLDFLRGDEPYKYEWGAVNEPIQRLLVRRSVAR